MNTEAKQPPVCADCLHYRSTASWDHKCHREAVERRNPIHGEAETVGVRYCDYDRSEFMSPRDGCGPEGRFFQAASAAPAKPSALIRFGLWLAAMFGRPAR